MALHALSAPSIQLPLPAPVTAEPRILAGYAARCDRCDFTGPVRADTLAAVGDYDGHVLSGQHVVALAVDVQTELEAAGLIEPEAES